jgi:RNA polymerase sigma-70 factor (ECF subfamily)
MRMVHASRSAAPRGRHQAMPVNNRALLSVLVIMPATQNAARDEAARDADAAVRQLYARHAMALHGYVERFCPDGASADDIVQETFIRAWRHLPRLSADERSVRPWLFRVARNLLTDASRAARSRPVTVPAQPAEEGRDDTGLNQVLDRQLVTGALRQLSPAHRAVLVEVFYGGDNLGRAARQLGIPHGTARSRLHYALQALRHQLEDHQAAESG